MASLRRNVASGLAVVVPVAVVLVVVQHLFRRIAGLPVVTSIEPVSLRVLIVITVFIVLVTGIGYAMRTAVGVLIADLITAGMNRIPGVRVVYNASQLAIETMLSGAEGRVETVKVESWEGLRVNAFDTGNRTDDGRVVCFFPTSPNITTGYVIEVEEEDLERTDEGIEHVLMRVLSGGFGEESAYPDAESAINGMRTVGRVRNVDIPDVD